MLIFGYWMISSSFPLELDFFERRRPSGVILSHVKYLQAFVFLPPHCELTLNEHSTQVLWKEKSHFVPKECAKMGDFVRNILPSLHLSGFSAPLEAFILKTL